jgi:predicted Zn finger-like uncharacterized protein
VLRDAAKNVMRVNMRLSCLNCLTEYDVPDAALAGRARTLRCAHCGHQWQHAGMAPEAAAVMAQPDFAPQAVPEMAPAAEPVMPLPSWMSAEPAEPVIPIDPGYSWAPPPAAPAGWPEFPTEMASRVEPLGQPVLRTFGQPEDQMAQAELVDAASREGPAPFSIVSHEFPPAIDQLAVPVDEVAAPAELPPLSDADFRTGPAVEADSFAALVSAARRKSLELEPEPPPPPPKVRTSNKKFFVLLILLLVIAVLVLEHRQIEAVLPASAGVFGAFGLR